MKYNTKELLTACKQVVKVLPKRGLQPILDCLKLDGYSITGTDLDTYLSVRLVSSDDHDIEMPFILPGKRLVEILSKITTKTVDISNGDNIYVVDENANSFIIDNLDPTDYPDPNFHPDIPGIEIEGLGQHLTNINHFCADYKLNGGSVITGISLKDNALVATDGNRLSLIDLTVDTTLDVIISCSTVTQLAGMLDKSSTLDLRVSDDKRLLKISANGWYAVTRLISGQFPQVKELFPKDTKQSITIKRSELLSIVKHFKVSKAEKKSVIKFDGYKVTNATDTITINQEMPLFGVNPNFLIEALEAFSSDELTLGYNGQLQPLIFTDSTSHKHLLMPIELKHANEFKKEVSNV